MSKPTIGIDCRLSGLAHGGIGRYIQEVYQRLLQDEWCEWVVFYSSDSQKSALAEKLSNKQREAIRRRKTSIGHYSLAEQTTLPFVFNREKLDFLHVPHFNVPLAYTGKTVVTIHDLLWHEQQGPEVTTLAPWVYSLKYQGYKQVVSRAIKHASAIFVPSSTIKQTVSTFVPGYDNKIQVTREGISETFQVSHSVKRERKTILYVGSLYPHKNVELVLKALAQLTQWRLRVVSARTVFAESFADTVNRLGLENRVTMLFNLSQADLVKEYQTATTVVQPSISEGFGLTGVEALACGAPLLASDIPVFREIYQDCATYFDPKSVESFINVVRTLSSDKLINEKSRQRLVAKYSWEKTAVRTRQLLQQVTAGR